MSDRKGGTPLWWITRSSDRAVTFFTGTLEEMVAHIDALHRATGVLHSGREI